MAKFSNYTNCLRAAVAHVAFKLTDGIARAVFLSKQGLFVVYTFEEREYLPADAQFVCNYQATTIDGKALKKTTARRLVMVRQELQESIQEDLSEFLLEWTESDLISLLSKLTRSRPSPDRRRPILKRRAFKRPNPPKKTQLPLSI